MSKHKYDYLFKILLIGESTSGKTQFVLRFTDDSLTANKDTTIGIDFKIKIININGKLIKLQIWDTAGQERFRSISKTYYKGAHGIILLYDVADQNSFKDIPSFMKIIECNAPNITCKVIVGNNCEKPDRVVTEEEGKKMADKFSLAFFEASPKTNQNINEVFNYLVQEILNSEGKKQTPNIELDNGKKKKEKNGCSK
jgi:small GTP-binding protein